MTDTEIFSIFKDMAPNAGFFFLLAITAYKFVKDSQKERKIEAEKEAERRQSETDRLIKAHTDNYDKIQITLNDYLEEFASMRAQLTVVENEQAKGTSERNEILKVLQIHDFNFKKVGLDIEKLKNRIE